MTEQDMTTNGNGRSTKGDGRKRQQRQQRSAQAQEDARLRQSALQLTVVVELATGARLPLLLCGLDQSEQLIEFQRVLASTKRSSDMTPLVCQALRPPVPLPASNKRSNKNNNQWTTPLPGWFLTAEALDRAWRVAQALLLRLRSLGVCGRVLLHESLQCITAVAMPPTTAQLDAGDQLDLAWHQLVVVSTSTDRDDAPLQRVFLVDHAALSSRTELPLHARLWNLRLLSWAHDHLFQRVDTATGQPHKSVVILRGIPGSGKSSMARDLVAICDAQQVTSTVCSADLSFETSRGYVFDASQLSTAHATCQAEFQRALHDPNVRVVIVDNTHTQRWEYESYEAWAKEQCPEHATTGVHVLEMHCRDLVACTQMAARNSHGVPVGAVIQMRLRWEPDDRAFVLEPTFAHAPVNRNPISKNGHAQHVAYLGLFVAPKDRAALLEQFPPAHDVVFAEHVTLFYRPTAQYLRYAPVGRSFTVDVDALFQDDQGQTLRVTLDKRLHLRTRNKVPHITVSVANDVSAYYSNELLEKDDKASQTAVCPRVTVPMQLGAVLVSHNRRVLSKTMPYPAFVCPVASLALTGESSSLAPPSQEINVILVSEKQILESKTHRYWDHALLTSHQWTHLVGSACPHNTRVLCVVPSSSPSPSTLVATALTFLERQLLLPDHQLRFHPAAVVTEPHELLAVVMSQIQPNWNAHVKVLDLTTDACLELNQLDATVIASWSVHHLSCRGAHDVQPPPCSELLDILDVFGLGVIEETRHLIETSIEAAEAALATLEHGVHAVVHRSDSCIVGLDADVVELTALVPESLDDQAEFLDQLAIALRRQGVHHTEVTARGIFYRVCTKATYAPLVQLRVVVAAVSAPRLRACVAQTQHVQRLSGGYYELFVPCAVLLRSALGAHCTGPHRGDVGLWAEQAVYKFFEHQQWTLLGHCTSSSSSSGDSEDEQQRVGSANVLHTFEQLVTFLEGWDAADWAALDGVDISEDQVRGMDLLGVVGSVCQVVDAGQPHHNNNNKSNHRQQTRDNALLRWVYNLTKASPQRDSDLNMARSCRLLDEDTRESVLSVR